MEQLGMEHRRVPWHLSFLLNIPNKCGKATLVIFLGREFPEDLHTLLLPQALLIPSLAAPRDPG